MTPNYEHMMIEMTGKCQHMISTWQLLMIMYFQYLSHLMLQTLQQRNVHCQGCLLFQGFLCYEIGTSVGVADAGNDVSGQYFCHLKRKISFFPVFFFFFLVASVTHISSAQIKKYIFAKVVRIAQ